jgi:hypothetical protein
MILLTKLLLAHLAGDFLFQPESWVLDKESKKHRSTRLYLHVLIHGVLTMLLVWDITFWFPALLIVISHYIIDLTKIVFQKPQNKNRWFAADQVLHLIVLVLVWLAWQNPSLSLKTIDTQTLLIVITGIIFLTNPSSIIIRTLISQWTPDTMYNLKSSLPDAGKFIGILERVLVFAFVLLHHWEAVGFLLAAKSVSALET